MKNIDPRKLPAVLSDEDIATILPLLKGRNTGWAEFRKALTDEQLDQIYSANETYLRTTREAKLATATPEEKDKQMLASAVHFARDHWFVTIFDEYDIVNGTGVYSYMTLDRIRQSTPINYAYNTIELRRNYMTDKEQFTFFTEGSPFTLCYPAKFIAEGLEFSSSLHYVIYKKAEVFVDRESMKRILSITEPDALLKAGRELKYFEKQVWNMNLKPILVTAVREKMLNHPELMQQLKATAGTTLVLADANDSKWGIGLDMNNNEATRRKNWRGKNLLGELLTEIRAEFTGAY